MAKVNTSFDVYKDKRGRWRFTIYDMNTAQAVAISAGAGYNLRSEAMEVVSKMQQGTWFNASMTYGGEDGKNNA